MREEVGRARAWRFRAAPVVHLAMSMWDTDGDTKDDSMKLKLSSEFLFQLFALLIIVIMVHAVYVGLIRPNADAILAQFDIRGVPVGGTPTAAALIAIRDELVARGPGEVTRSVILATDGAPNCNPEPPIGPPMCFCTHPDPVVCARAREENCLDDEAAIDAVNELTALAVPVYVLGLTDPGSAPILGEVLDRMAIAGGRARPTGERRFYDIRSAEELSGTLGEITNSVSRCTLYLEPGAEIRDDDVLILLGREVPRDRSRMNGWDLTDEAAGEVTLFGDSCGLLADGAVLEACVLE